MKIKSVKSINPCISVIQMGNDIMTKGHGGSINVSTSTNQGTVFSVQLPA
jgi:hypothetical protein